MSEMIPNAVNANKMTAAEWLAWVARDPEAAQAHWHALRQESMDGPENEAYNPVKIYFGAYYAAVARSYGPDSPEAQRALSMLASLDAPDTLNHPRPEVIALTDPYRQGTIAY